MQTITLQAHFDGKQILLDEPYPLEPNTKLVVSVVQMPTEVREDWTCSSSVNLEQACNNEEPELDLIVADQTEFRLSSSQWEAFCERLDEPAKVIPALQSLFKKTELANAG